MDKPTHLIKPERLNKFLAHAGFGSRRQVEELILAGRVSLNGETVRELGVRVEDGQKVTVDGESVRAEKHVYYIVNKPRGYLCTNHDPDNRPLVVELVPQVSQRVYTVGRLDESSEGLVLMTNDGDLAHRMMHPRFGVEKVYHVQVAGFPTPPELKQLTDGIWLSVGRVKAKKVKRLKTQGQSTWLKIILNEGKNREIRRMLAKLKHKVLALKRMAVGPIELGHLPTGKARKLKHAEVELLKEHVYQPELLQDLLPKPRKPKR